MAVISLQLLIREVPTSNSPLLLTSNTSKLVMLSLPRIKFSPSLYTRTAKGTSRCLRVN
jgi:hypothetical protein